MLDKPGSTGRLGKAPGSGELAKQGGTGTLGKAPGYDVLDKQGGMGYLNRPQSTECWRSQVSYRGVLMSLDLIEILNHCKLLN